MNLEKAFDQVPRKCYIGAYRQKGISEKLVRAYKSIYDRAMTTV